MGFLIAGIVTEMKFHKTFDAFFCNGFLAPGRTFIVTEQTHFIILHITSIAERRAGDI